jgi:hypothetical protein
MIHAREDYNRIQDPAGKIADDEPVFLVRAKDVLGPDTLRAWAQMLENNNGDPNMVAMVRDHANLMIEWQYINGCKLPDL